MYLGLTALTITNAENIMMEGTTDFILSVLGLTFAGRAMTVLIPMMLIWIANCGKIIVSCNEILLIIVGGSIRGPIAFGLSLQLASPHSLLMKTTTQILVLVSTVVLGSLIGILSKFLTLSEEVVPISLQEPLIRHSRSDAFLVRQPTHEMHNHNYKGFARWFKEFDKKKIMPLFRREDHDFSMYYGNPEEHRMNLINN